jgi:hypothetical protein
MREPAKGNPLLETVIAESVASILERMLLLSVRSLSEFTACIRDHRR